MKKNVSSYSSSEKFFKCFIYNLSINFQEICITFPLFVVPCTYWAYLSIYYQFPFKYHFIFYLSSTFCVYFSIYSPFRLSLKTELPLKFSFISLLKHSHYLKKIEDFSYFSVAHKNAFWINLSFLPWLIYVQQTRSVSLSAQSCQVSRSSRTNNYNPKRIFISIRMST